MVLGIDLNDGGSRISYLGENMELPETLSQVTGGEAFCVPMAIAKRAGDEHWSIGDKAVSLGREDGVKVIDDLISKALHDDIVVANGREYSSFELLLAYLKGLLQMAALIEPWQGAERICISSGEMGAQTIALIKKLTASLDYPSEQVDIIGRSEGFYEYVMHQKEELWNHDVMLLDCMGKGVVARRLTVNRRTRPAVCRIYTEVDEGLDVNDDDAFREFCEKQMEGRIITSVYIAGEQVTRERMEKTMRYLCMKRRVFYGHNVYTKGACHAAFDRQHGIDRRRSYLYLGKDKLKSNVGLRVRSVNEEVYVPLVDAGINWYDVRVRKEIYLGRERELRLLLTPLTGRNEHYAIMRLGDIPPRPAHTTRVRISLTMDSEDYIKVTVEDLGFGEIFPASGVVMTEMISVAM